MIVEAEKRGTIKPGDTLIEATSGNTGIALAMVAAMRGYRMMLVMPENQTVERVQTMRAYGAELVLTPKAGGMEAARDIAERMRAEGKGVILDQFANPDNPLAHYRGTGPEIWRDTDGRITHFVSAMGTTGTIMGVSRFLKEKNPAIADRRRAAGGGLADSRASASGRRPTCRRSSMRRASIASRTCRRPTPRTWRARLAREEGIFGGICSGGACAVALRISQRSRERDDRVRRLRPRRPLSVDRRVPA